MELKGTNILVTGASGFLGGRIVEILCRNDCRVRALVRNTSNANRLRLLPVQLTVGELSDPPSLRKALEGCGAMIHCAGKVTDWGSRDEFYRANVQGTKNLMEACLASGVTRAVVLSSLTVLGIPRREEHFDESSSYDPNPRSYYPESKIAAEKIALASRAKGLSVVIVRPAGIWGPGDPVFFPRLRALAERGWLCRVGGGGNKLGMSYVDNVAEGAMCAIEAENPGPVYHIVDQKSVTSATLMARIAEIAGWKMRSFGLPYWVLYGAASLLEAGYRLLRVSASPALTRYGLRLFACDGRYSCQKARSELGYTGRVNFDEGLRRLAGWIGTIG